MLIVHEVSLIIKQNTREKTLAIAKRCLENIYNKGGFINKVESLGLVNLPQIYKKQSKGSYFIAQYVAPFSELKNLQKSFKMDQDVLYSFIVPLRRRPEKVECTLQEDLKPPIYRPEVQQMIKEAEERNPKGKYLTHLEHLGYYPFPQ